MFRNLDNAARTTQTLSIPCSSRPKVPWSSSHPLILRPSLAKRLVYFPIRICILELKHVGCVGQVLPRAARVSVQPRLTATSQIVGAQHAGLEAVEEPFELRHAGGDNAGGEYDLRADYEAPFVEGWIGRVRTEVRIDNLACCGCYYSKGSGSV